MSRKEPFASRASRTTEPHPSPAFPAFPPAEAESEGSDVAASRPPPIEAACAMAASSDDDTSSLASFAQKALKARSSESRSLAGPGATPSANPPGEDSAREVSRARSSADSSLPSPRFLSNSSTVAEPTPPLPFTKGEPKPISTRLENLHVRLVDGLYSLAHRLSSLETGPPLLITCIFASSRVFISSAHLYPCPHTITRCFLSIPWHSHGRTMVRARSIPIAGTHALFLCFYYALPGHSLRALLRTSSAFTTPSLDTRSAPSIRTAWPSSSPASPSPSSSPPRSRAMSGAVGTASGSTMRPMCRAARSQTAPATRTAPRPTA